MMQVRKLSPHIGAEVTGIDLRRVDAETAGRLNRAILENVCYFGGYTNLRKTSLMCPVS